MASEAPYAALSGLFWAGLLAAAALDDHLELVLAGV